MLTISQGLRGTHIACFSHSASKFFGAVFPTFKSTSSVSHYAFLCSKEIQDALKAQKNIKENEKIYLAAILYYHTSEQPLQTWSHVPFLLN